MALIECGLGGSPMVLVHEETPEQVKERIGEMREFLEEVSGWYDQIRTMPRPTLLKLMRMGTHVAKIVS